MPAIYSSNQLASFSELTGDTKSVLCPQLTRVRVRMMMMMMMVMRMLRTVVTGSLVSSSTLTRPRGSRKGKSTEMKPTAPTLG